MPPSIRSCRVPTLLLATLAVLAPATRGLAQQATGAGRSRRYAFVLGIPGVAAGTQTLYAADPANDLLLVFEYNARAGRLDARAVARLRPVAAKLAGEENRQPDPAIVRRYTLATGLPGVAAGTQTLYVADDARRLLYVYEYHGRAHTLRLRTGVNLHRYALAAAKGKPRPALAGADKVPRYALAIGAPGVARRTQTLYVADDCHDWLLAFEYSAASGRMRFRNVADLRRLADRLPPRPLLRAPPPAIPVPRYTLVAGIAGSAPGSETLYVLGDAKQALLVVEYSARSHKFVPRRRADLHPQPNQAGKAGPRP